MFGIQFLQNIPVWPSSHQGFPRCLVYSFFRIYQYGQAPIKVFQDVWYTVSLEYTSMAKLPSRFSKMFGIHSFFRIYQYGQAPIKVFQDVWYTVSLEYTSMAKLPSRFSKMFGIQFLQNIPVWPSSHQGFPRCLVYSFFRIYQYGQAPIKVFQDVWYTVSLEYTSMAKLPSRFSKMFGIQFLQNIPVWPSSHQGFPRCLVYSFFRIYQYGQSPIKVFQDVWYTVSLEYTSMAKLPSRFSKMFGIQFLQNIPVWPSSHQGFPRCLVYSFFRIYQYGQAPIKVLQDVWYTVSLEYTSMAKLPSRFSKMFGIQFLQNIPVWPSSHQGFPRCLVYSFFRIYQYGQAPIKVFQDVWYTVSLEYTSMAKLPSRFSKMFGIQFLQNIPVWPSSHQGFFLFCGNYHPDEVP